MTPHPHGSTSVLAGGGEDERVARRGGGVAQLVVARAVVGDGQVARFADASFLRRHFGEPPGAAPQPR
jgi:hypothetical protein